MPQLPDTNLAFSIILFGFLTVLVVARLTERVGKGRNLAGVLTAKDGVLALTVLGFFYLLRFIAMTLFAS